MTSTRFRPFLTPLPPLSSFCRHSVDPPLQWCLPAETPPLWKIFRCPILNIIKHKTKKSDVTLYLRNLRAQRVDFGICHKQNIGEEPGQVKFGVPSSGPTSDSKRCWKMESWGPGMHSFDASTLNFGEVVQHISPLNKHYWHFLIPPSGPALGSRRCWKLDSCSQGAQSYGDFHISFWVLWANTINT